MEIASLLMLVALVCVAAAAWPNMPDRIPTHFGLSGEPNNWGSKSGIWILVGIGGFIYVLLSLLPRFEGAWNMPVVVTPENRERVMPLVLEMTAVLKLLILPVFLWITWCITQQRALGPWFLPFVLVSSIGAAIFYQIRIRRAA